MAQLQKSANWLIVDVSLLTRLREIVPAAQCDLQRSCHQGILRVVLSRG